jgi:hypothetical protein
LAKVAFKDQFKPTFLAFEKTTYLIFYVPCDVFMNAMFMLTNGIILAIGDCDTLRLGHLV